MKKIEFKNGIVLEIQDGEDLFKAFYRLFCWNCEKAPYCHESCSEFDDSCDNIVEIEEMLEELGVKSL